MAGKVTDSTFISGVKNAYRRKGQAVTSNEVVDEILRRSKERPSRLSKLIIKFEVANKLSELADKHKIGRTIKNRKEYFMPIEES